MTRSLPSSLVLNCLALCLLSWGWSRIAVAAPVMQDCGYYKLSPGALSQTVHKFTNAVQQLLVRRADLQQRLAQGETLIEELYRAGILEAIPGCYHDQAGKNVTVRGGDPLEGVKARGSGAVEGFSVVIRGLPAKLCQAMPAESTPGRLFRVRPEIPKKAPGRIGDCVYNPVTGLLTLGRVLPMPNTLYVFQSMPLAQGSQEPPRSNCSVALADQQLNQDIADGPCSQVKSGRAPADDKVACAEAQQRVADYLHKLKRDPRYADVASWPAEQRLNTIRPLFATYHTPYDSSLATRRADYISGMFAINSDNNLDAAYWAAELPRYQQIAQQIRVQACSSGWAQLLTEPARWKQLMPATKRTVLEEIHQAFSTVIPIQLQQFYVDTSGQLSRQYPDTNGGYISHVQKGEVLTTPDGKSLADSIIILESGYHRSLKLLPVSLQHSLTVVLEELMHAHQQELGDDYISEQLPRSSNACVQAPLFLYNQLVYFQPGANKHFFKGLDIAWDFLWGKRYPSQPREKHAKLFADYVTDLLLSEPPGCP